MEDLLHAASWLGGPSVRRGLVCLLVGMTAAGVLAAASSLTATPERARPSNLELTIPAGAAEAVARGETPLSIPAKLQFQPRAKLLIRNEDSVPHQLAWLFIAPGDEYEAPVAALFQSSGRFVCSFHVGGSVTTESLAAASSGFAPSVDHIAHWAAAGGGNLRRQQVDVQARSRTPGGWHLEAS